MNILYIDAFSGISGDKTVAALLSLSGKYEYLKKQLATLNIDDEFKIELTKKNVQGIDAAYFNVILKEHDHEHTRDHHDHEEEHGNHDSNPHHEHHIHRNLSDIEKIIDGSSITADAKKISKGIFKLIAEAESKIHGKSIDDVHFHEVGAVDSIIDIVSTAILIDVLEVDEIYSSVVPTGSGFVVCQHGIFPVPAPATADILKGIPTDMTDIKGELTTPTGAAIVRYLAKEFGTRPVITVAGIGYGAGTKEFPIPNVLRVELGTKTEIAKSGNDFENDKVVKLETNIDDATPENIAYLSQMLFDKNALDVFTIPVVMKKGRLASLLTVICYEKDRPSIEKEIFLNSSTFGIRHTGMDRTVLKREIKEMDVDGIKVRIKYGYMKDKVIQKSIEYEDARLLAEKKNISFKEAVDLINKKI